MKKITILSLLLSPLISFANSYVTDNSTQPKVNFTIIQMSDPTIGEFKNSVINLNLDLNNPNNSKVSVSLPIKNLTADAQETNGIAQTKDWFNSAVFPTANFESEKIVKINATSFEASGNLIVKGITKKMKIPFTINETTKSIHGEFDFLRSDFKLGEGLWSDTPYLANEVKIKFQFKIK